MTAKAAHQHAPGNGKGKSPSVTVHGTGVSSVQASAQAIAKKGNNAPSFPGGKKPI